MWCKRHRECVYFNILLSHRLFSGITFSAYIFRINGTTHKKYVCVCVGIQTLPQNIWQKRMLSHAMMMKRAKKKLLCRLMEEKKIYIINNNHVFLSAVGKYNMWMYELPIAIKFSANFNISYGCIKKLLISQIIVCAWNYGIIPENSKLILTE